MNIDREPQQRSENTDQTMCPCSNGYLPTCAPLAQPYVPYQQENARQYDHQEALAQGTLFPGLNLPFYKSINGEPVPVTPLSELQALDFVLAELGLYLNSHPEDQDAFALFRQYAELEKRGKKEYEARFGPLTQCASADHKHYEWIHGPWPWEIGGKR